MNDHHHHKPKHPSNSEINSILHALLAKTVESFNHQAHVSQTIQRALEYRQEKGLIFATTHDPKLYIPQLWDHFFGDKVSQKNHAKTISVVQVSDETLQQKQMSPKRTTNQILLEAAVSRQNCIWDELKDNKLKIQIKAKYKSPQKPSEQLNKNKESLPLNESKATANSQKDFLQFIKNQKLQKEKRKKILEIQHMKQLQKQKKLNQQQQKLKEIQQAKQRQEKRKKQQQLLKKRYTQKQIIKRHQSAYNEFQNKIYHSTQKQQNLNSLHRFQSQQLKKIKQEKQKMYKSFEKSRIDQHQKSYLDSVQKRNSERYKRMEEIKQIQQIQNQKSRIKFQSSFKFQKHQQEYEKKKKEEYMQAKQKRDRILSYKEKVKSDFVPEVDQNKRNQLLKLMEDLEMSRKGQYRKKVMKDGEVVLEKIDLKDARQVGLNYLEDIKKEVAKMRAMKRESGDSFMESTPQQDPKLKKPINYLKQMRQSKSKSSSGFMNPRKTTFTNTKSSQISFDQKMRKIEDMTKKLMEKTKQQQMLLKYGKFKTSQEILSKKQIIDRNYIDLLNMKLEMIQREEKRFGS